LDNGLGLDLPMKEDEWLLPKHDECCITKFYGFGQGEKKSPVG